MAKNKKSHPVREQIAEAIAKTKRVLGKAQSDLDKAGEERKELTPDMVDALREGLTSIFVDADEEAIEAGMQLMVETMTEAQPESDVDEERAEGDVDEERAEGDEDEEEDKDEDANKALSSITKEVADMAKGYNELIGDVAGVMEVVTGVVDVVKSKADEKNEFDARLKAIEKQIAQRPRRASQAKETELDSDSELGKEIEKQLFTAPTGYEDMFKNGGSA